MSDDEAKQVIAANKTRAGQLEAVMVLWHRYEITTTQARRLVDAVDSTEHTYD